MRSPGLTNAQLLYTLPVSLFGMSVSAAELPAMSGEVGVDAAAASRCGAGSMRVFGRLRSLSSRRRWRFLRSAMSSPGALFQTGRFTRVDAVYVWGILAGSAVGLLASTLGRLYSSTYYALRDTRTPLRYALVRVALTTVLGYVFALPLPRLLGMAPQWGAAGLTASAGIAGWVEMLLLRHTLNARIGRTGLSAEYAGKLWASALVGAAVAWAVKLATPPLRPHFGRDRRRSARTGLCSSQARGCCACRRRRAC